MSDLRDQIAAMLMTHQHVGGKCLCQTLREQTTSGQHAKHVADAVIRELRQEYRIDIGYGGYEFEQDRAAAVERLQEIHEDWGDDPPETGTVLQHRYVTEWENDDE